MVRKTVTLVFCDVADSTPLGERLDLEAQRGVWSRYHETAREVIERHGGTIAKFIGDAVMAVFGIPHLHEDDALRAVRAAVELREELARLNDELDRAYGVRIEVRTGINTGEVFAGDPGHGDPFATGDPIVVAQRLEAAAAGGEILVGDATIRLVRDAVSVERMPLLALKGKAQPVVAWRLLDVEAGVAGLLRRMDSPLVGRGAELARLLKEFRRVDTERSCRVVTVLGDPGVGKSRLAAELVASLADPTLVLEGRCLPYGTAITYWPLVEIVDRLDLERLLEAEPDGETVRRRLLEAVGRAEPVSRSDELHWAVRRLLETLARERPVVLVLDDVQWAEPAFLDLVEYLAGWSRDVPILVCCLARTDLAELRPSWASAATIELAPLAHGDAQRLLENLAGPLDRSTADGLWRATGGNPLFLEEMLRMLVEDGVLVERDGLLRSLTKGESLRVPETVQAVLAARLGRLEADELAVLQRAAVIGQVFWWGAVADLTPPERTADVSGRLQALVRKGLIQPDRRTFAGEDGFSFGHILIRDAAYESMPKRLRGTLHERFAGWVERAGRGAEFDEIRGHHLEQAYAYRIELGPPDDGVLALGAKAGRLLGVAGHRALLRGDATAAAHLLQRAVALPADERRLGERRLDLARALKDSGELARAGVVLTELLEIALEAGDLELELHSLIEQSFLRLYIGSGEVDEFLAIAARAVEVFTAAGNDGGLAAAWNLVAHARFVECRVEAMEEALRTAIPYAERAGDRRLVGFFRIALARAALVGPTPVERGLERCAQLLEEGGGDRLLEAVVSGIVGYLAAMEGRFAEAREHSARSRNLLAEIGMTVLLGGGRTYSGAIELLAGAPDAAEAELRAGVATLQEIGEKGNLATVAAYLGEALAQQGRDEEAFVFTVLSEESSAPFDVTSHVAWRAARALVKAHAGELAEAEALAREAVRQAEATDYLDLQGGALARLAEVLEGDEAAVATRDAVARYEAKGNVVAARRVAGGTTSIAIGVTPTSGSRSSGTRSTSGSASG